jgi:hypothetical protein
VVAASGAELKRDERLGYALAQTHQGRHHLGVSWCATRHVFDGERQGQAELRDALQVVARIDRFDRAAGGVISRDGQDRPLEGRNEVMILAMTQLTFFHVLLSLIETFAGFVVVLRIDRRETPGPLDRGFPRNDDLNQRYRFSVPSSSLHAVAWDRNHFAARSGARDVCVLGSAPGRPVTEGLRHHCGDCAISELLRVGGTAVHESSGAENSRANAI